MSDVRVFVSFDVANDSDLYDLIVEQSRLGGSGFEISAFSEAREPPGSAHVRKGIGAADEVIFLCGEFTDQSDRATEELRIAREEEKPYFLLWGRRETMCKRPQTSKPTDMMYSWTGEILREMIATTLRATESPQVPEGLKRTPTKSAKGSE